jgi:hypothetical protein
MNARAGVAVITAKINAIAIWLDTLRMVGFWLTDLLQAHDGFLPISEPPAAIKSFIADCF